jgi:hypothetical protein
MEHYSHDKLRHIANQCAHFEQIIQAMGYGYSLANVAADRFIESCDDCVHWSDGNCEILKRFLTH